MVPSKPVNRIESVRPLSGFGDVTHNARGMPFRTADSKLYIKDGLWGRRRIIQTPGDRAEVTAPGTRRWKAPSRQNTTCSSW